MPFIRLPSNQEPLHAPARGPVLLLTCMDLRLMDEIVDFMDSDGLNNRYDHLIFAGASLGALGAPDAKGDYSHWNKTFADHLAVAHRLHGIKDIYVLEHRDCGAYREFLGYEGDFDDYHGDAEELCHRKYTGMLQQFIDDWAKANNTTLRVKAFLMDLRGNVKYLEPQEPASARRSSKPKARAKR
jgi:hypothetical protein